jgi:predicted ATPase
MEVTKVRFEAFKSLYDVTCELDRFTVITGANGSGKSNLVDAINFLGEVYADGLEFAVGRAGGYDNIAHRRTRRAKRNVAVTVDVRLDASDARQSLGLFGFGNLPDPDGIPDTFSLLYRHSFALGTAGQSLISDFSVRHDVVEVFDSRGRLALHTSKSAQGLISFRPADKRVRLDPWTRAIVGGTADSPLRDFYSQRRLSPTSLVSDELFFAGLLMPVRFGLGRTRIFQLSPYQCRTTGVPTPNAVLQRHGENLPGAADHLRRNDAQAWKRVQAAMRAILPDLQGIEVAYTEDRRLAIQFRERGVGRPWNVGEISDGTIQALALFIALYDERAPLLVIEEPENSVHPWILRQFLDLCRESVSKQIVMTSHSPVLLNYVDPKIVRLMYVRNGRSQITRLIDAAPKIRNLVLGGQLSIFDAYDSGVVPDALPRGFAPVVKPSTDT